MISVKIKWQMPKKTAAKIKRLKIAMVVYQFPSVSETFIMNQIAGLIELGHEIDIFAFKNNQDVQKIHEKFLEYRLLDKTAYIFSIPQIRSDRIKRALFIISRYFIKRPRCILRCLNLARFSTYEALDRLFKAEPFMRKRYDIIHCQFGEYGRSLIFLKEILNTKIIAAFRGYDISQYVYRHSQDVYSELFHKADALLPVCSYFEAKLLNLGCPKEKIEIMQSGIDLNEFEYVRRNFDFKNTINILTVARLVEKKGIRYAIAAVGELAKKYKNIQYNIIGDGELKAELQQCAKEFGVERSITFLGEMTQKEIKGYLYKSDIFVLPCVSARNGDQEGIPNVLKEAMSTGMPVISTYHSGIPELVIDGESGFLVPERDSGALTEKLIYLIEHPELCQEMGKKGREFVEKNFCINRLNNKLLSIYKNLLYPHAKINRSDKINIVLFWFMNDWGKYGRAYEKIVEQLSQVSFVKNIVCYFPPIWAKGRAGLHPFFIKKASKNIFLITPNARFSNLPEKMSRLRDKIKDCFASLTLKSFMRLIGIEKQNTISWMFPPHWYLEKLLTLIPHRFLIMQVVDNNTFREQGDLKKNHFVKMQYEKLAKLSNMVITFSQLNYDLFSSINPRCYLFENAVDPIFIKRPTRSPYHICQGRPRLGYVGSISQRTDIKLLDYVARARPEYDLVIAGPQEEDVNQYGTLNLPNVFYKGVIPYLRVPQFLEIIDVCLIPHKDTLYCRSMSPLKLFQYLGSGRPIVSTPISGIERWYGFILVAHTYQEFVEKIDRALKEDTIQLSNRRIQAAQSQTWEIRMNEMCKAIMSNFFIEN